MRDVPLSSHDQRTLLVGVLTIGMILLVFRGLPAGLRWERARHDASRRVIEEARESALAVRSRPVFEKALRIGEQRYFALAPSLLEGEPMAAAGAALAAAVSDAAAVSNLQISTLEAHADSVADSVRHGEITRLSLRGEATGDVSGVAHFFALLEGGNPMVAFRNVSITPSDPPATDNRPEALRVTFTVEALARVPDLDEHMDKRTVAGSVSVANALIPLREVLLYDRVVLDRAADSVVRGDPFRFVHKPTQVPFGTPPPSTSPPPARARPQLVLGGITGGPPWRAVLNGIPNHEGSSVVAPGDTLGGLRIRRIRPDTVVVQGDDTTWTLIRITTRRH